MDETVYAEATKEGLEIKVWCPIANSYVLRTVSWNEIMQTNRLKKHQVNDVPISTTVH